MRRLRHLLVTLRPGELNPWLRRWLLGSPRQLEAHHAEVIVNASETDTDTVKQMSKEIEGRIEQGVAAGEDEATTRTALEEIARRYRATLDDFSED